MDQWLNLGQTWPMADGAGGNWTVTDGCPSKLNPSPSSTCLLLQWDLSLETQGGGIMCNNFKALVGTTILDIIVLIRLCSASALNDFYADRYDWAQYEVKCFKNYETKLVWPLKQLPSLVLRTSSLGVGNVHGVSG